MIKLEKLVNDIMVAITCRLSEKGKCQMELLEDHMNHCKHSITNIIEHYIDKEFLHVYADVDQLEYEIEQLEKELKAVKNELTDYKSAFRMRLKRNREK